MSIGNSATPIGKVRKLGSAHSGADHWLTGRITSTALLLLGTWFIASLLLLPKLDLRTVVEWLHGPSGAVPMALFVVTAFWHGFDGLKVIIEDYIEGEANKWALSTLAFFLAVTGASLSLFAIGKIAFGAAA
jgi:succinate dehydrogenase / fumarate reductase membrane anchor subunit